MDQPSVDGFDTYCLSKLASEAGEKVVLSALGGDQLFAGDTSFEVLPEIIRKSKLLIPIGFLIRPISRMLYKTLSPRRRRTADALNNAKSLTAAQQRYKGLFSIYEAYELTNIVCKRAPKEMLEAEPNHPSQADNISHI